MTGFVARAIVLALAVDVCAANYNCLCFYTIQTPVYAEQPIDLNVDPMGYLYEFDCRQVLHVETNSSWASIVFDHKIGYVQYTNQLEVETCTGEPVTVATLSTASVESSTRSTEAEMTEPPTSLPTTTPTEGTTPPTSGLPTTAPPTSTILPTTPTSPTEGTTPPTSRQTTTPPPTTSTERTVSFSNTDRTRPFPTSTTPTLMTDRTTPPLPSTAQASHSVEVIEGCSEEHVRLANNESGLLFTYRHTCYELVPTELEWYLAEQDCQMKHGHLAHITDTYEQHALLLVVQEHHREDVWIGLHDRDDEGNFEWSSGDPLVYENWVPDFSSLIHSIEDCVTMLVDSAGQWDEILCGQDRGYICEFDTVMVNHTLEVATTVAPETALATDGDVHLCPTHIQTVANQYGTLLAQYEGSCYEILHNKVSWQDAEDLCVEAGGHLATISSDHEQAYVAALMDRHNSDYAVWLGLHDLNTEGHFEWTSGTNVTYTNWVTDHKDNFADHTDEDCVAFIPYQEGLWDDIPCHSQERHLAFCEYKITEEGMEATIIG